MPDVVKALTDRRARRSFDARIVPPEVQDALWRAVQIAPSHGNAQPTRILIAQDPATRAAVEDALSAGNRGWATAAPLLAAIATIPSHDTVQANLDGTERELWAFHAGIAAAQLLVQATEMGLIAHPMAGFDEHAVRAAFTAPNDVRILAVVAIGFPGPIEQLPEDLQKAETRPQNRIPLEHLVVRDRWEGHHSVSARELRK